MALRDNLRPGSFRGVPFHTEDAELAGGRRLAEHEYPSRDDVYTEDLGRKGRVYAISAYVIGDDYAALRDDLKRALEQAGPGRFVHHFLGELRVAVRGFTLRESTSEGGMARFLITFVEAGVNLQPAARPDTAAITVANVEAKIAAVISDFASRFTTDGQPQFVSDAAQGIAKQFSEGVAVLTAPSSDTGKRASLAAAIAKYEAEVSVLVGNPTELATRSIAIVAGLAGLGSPAMTLPLLRRVVGFGASLLPVPTTTESRRVQARNQTAQTALIRRSVAAEFSRTVSQITPVSRDDARALRDETALLLDDAALDAADQGDDTSYKALMTLRAAVVNDLTARGAALAPLVSITPDAELSSLFWAYDLYEDLARADEIVARNSVIHPAFIPAGIPFEALAE